MGSEYPFEDEPIETRIGMLVRLRDRRIVTVVGPVTEGYMKDTVVVAQHLEHVQTSDICEVLDRG